jgi:hypothetical protein
MTDPALPMPIEIGCLSALSGSTMAEPGPAAEAALALRWFQPSLPNTAARSAAQQAQSAALGSSCAFRLMMEPISSNSSDLEARVS